MRSRIDEPKSSEVTPYDVYLRRREFLRRAGLFAATSLTWGAGLTALSGRGSADPPKAPPALPLDPAWKNVRRGAYRIDEQPTRFEAVTTYNNYYELGLSKSAPAELGHLIQPRPWSVRIAGEVEKPFSLDIDTMLRWFGLEERIYRMRCVEAWSMVIPWVGFPLAALLTRIRPTSRAKFVQLTTLHDPEQLPNQTSDVLPWPYVEGLRMDEAVHPLTFLAVGLYGVPLPGQNGAPLRLVVPWKYGFKGTKSIVEVRLVAERPATTWNLVAPQEYGFFANVNPTVDHPRWSQATERRIGELGRRETLPFNGYGKEVAHLYKDMDLRRYF